MSRFQVTCSGCAGVLRRDAGDMGAPPCEVCGGAGVVPVDQAFWREGEIAVVDTETTGLDPAIDRVVEVAVVILRRGETVERASWLVNPLRPIPEPATRVHGIGDADVLGAPIFLELAGRLEGMLAGRPVAAFGARFDRAVLLSEWLRASWCLDAPVPAFLCMGFPWIDVLTWARVSTGGVGSHTLAAVADRLGISVADTLHRAESDAQLAADVLWKFATGRHHDSGGDEIRGMPERLGELAADERRHAVRLRNAREERYAAERERGGSHG